MIPSRPAPTASTLRRPKYISYATQSISGSFTPSGGGSPTTFAQNLTPTSPGCQSSLNSSLTCSVQLPGLSPGQYTASFTLYDGMLDGSNVPTGNVLSANQSLPVTISPGQANTIAVTLGGVPVAVSVIPAASSTLAGSQSSRYTLSKCLGFEAASAEQVSVIGADADGNYILGPGAPTPALVSSDASMAAVATPSPTSPNRFALSRGATPATAGSTFTLTASVTPLATTGGTTPVSVTVPVSFDTTLCGVVSTLAGSAGTTGSADGTGSAATFNRPFGVTTDRSGNVYVADSYNHIIREISPSGVVSTLAGSAGAFGYADGTGSAARFSYPSDVTVGGDGNVYVADTNTVTIRKITPAGVVTTFAGHAGQVGSIDGTPGYFDFPKGVAADGLGNLYVADTGAPTIRKITPAGAVTTVAGTKFSPGSTDGTGAAARFNTPTAVAVDGSGNVYVADTANHVIRKITPAGVVSTFAGSAGNPGYADGTGTAAMFYNPRGVAVDAFGDVYVADCDNLLIRKITPAGVVSTVAGSAGTIGSADGRGSAATFNYPYGIAVDSSGTIYIGDTSNQLIRKIQ